MSVGYVQSCQGGGAAAAVSRAAVFTNPVVSGNLLVAGGYWANATPGTPVDSNVTDTQGNTWHLVKQYVNAGVEAFGMWYTLASANTIPTVTLTPGTGTNSTYIRLAVHEYNGGPDTVEISDAQFSASVPIATGFGYGITTAKSDAVLVVWAVWAGGTDTWDAPVTSRQTVVTNGISGDEIITSPGTYTPTAHSTSITRCGLIAAYFYRSVTSTLAVGEVLQTSQGGWHNSPSSFAYQWERCDASGANPSDIPGATSSVYIVDAADAGHTLRVAVTAGPTNQHTLISSATDVVQGVVPTGITATRVVNGTAPGRATHACNRQHLMYVPGQGIFWCYLSHEDTTNDNGTFSVIQSTDNGVTWGSSLITGNDANQNVSRPGPCLAVDTSGNVYVFATDQGSTGPHTGPNNRFIKFPIGNYSSYTVYGFGTTDDSSDKYCCMYNPSSDRLWWCRGDSSGSSGASLSELNPSTGVRTRYFDTTHFLSNHSSPTIFLHYPHMYYDPVSGAMLIDWCTTHSSYPNNYYDIQFLISHDDGVTWNGPGGVVTFPIDCTHYGSAYAVMPTSEYDESGGSSYRWNASSWLQDNKLHFLYTSAPDDKIWYCRYDYNPATHAISNRITTYPNTLSGDTYTLNAFSAVFSGTGLPGARLYVTGNNSVTSKICQIYSDDAGLTWHDYTQMATTSPNVYQINASTRLGQNAGEVIGVDVWTSGSAVVDSETWNLDFFKTVF